MWLRLNAVGLTNKYQGDINMIIIAFSSKTSKILPRIFCHYFRHCAPIFRKDNKLVMYQFTHMHNISEIELQDRDITILRAHGWCFVYVPMDIPHDFNPITAYSCVDLSKRALSIRNLFIQTPYDLYKYIAPK